MTAKISPPPPYDFELSASIFSEGDPEIQRYESGNLWTVLKVNEKLILACIESIGSTEKPTLAINLKSKQTISIDDKKQVKESVSNLLNLSLDLKPFYDQVKQDSVMKSLTERLNGLKSPTTKTIFEALIDSIVEQQISLAIANIMEHRLIKLFGEKLVLDSNLYYSFPTALALANVSLRDLRTCGLSQRKAEYIKTISQMVNDGTLDLEKLKGYDDPDLIIKELDKIRGIGVWTAELTMIRGMQKFEAFPADDLGLRRVISHYYCSDKRISNEEAREIAGNWGQWKGLAGYYLIVAAANEIPVP